MCDDCEKTESDVVQMRKHGYPVYVCNECAMKYNNKIEYDKLTYKLKENIIEAACRYYDDGDEVSLLDLGDAIDEYRKL